MNPVLHFDSQRTRLSRSVVYIYQGRIQDFKLGGALEKLRRVEGGAKIFGVFRVKNHDFTPTNLILTADVIQQQEINKELMN
jgi:hypothetical protein